MWVAFRIPGLKGCMQQEELELQSLFYIFVEITHFTSYRR